MSRFQIPLDLEISFIKYVVCPSFKVRPPLQDQYERQNWMRNKAQNYYDPHLENLIDSSIRFATLEKAIAEIDNLSIIEQLLLQQQALQSKFIL